MARIARVLAAIAVLTSGVTLAAGEDRLSLVPWQVLEPASVVDAPLVLFWIPASSDELRRSELLTSYDLTLFSSRCVAMRVVRLNDRVRLTNLGVGAELPAAVLTDRAGNILGRVEPNGGALAVSEVEDLVREELDRREAEAEARLDRAREFAEDEHYPAAMALYRAVFEDRCMCPRQGRDARRAMKKIARK
jgi:hypothetical protein